VRRRGGEGEGGLGVVQQDGEGSASDVAVVEHVAGREWRKTSLHSLQFQSFL
jgi:hypothetical protein